ncbi:McrC family protein [Streptomyces sp. BBFR102]|uniref:McrC family protein n=1 Tax=Streptomyces sp. BBFR102 TaxID=3448171 RepID=UPI003F53B262
MTAEPEVTRVDLVEHGPWTGTSLPPEVGCALAASGIVDARPDPFAAGTGSSWQLRGLAKVGAVRLGDVEVHIAPKLPVGRLFFLLGYTADPERHWRRGFGEVEVGDEEELLPTLADAFLRQAERALGPGPLQGYRTRDDALSVVRGRLRPDEQLRRRFGVPLPVEVTYDEYTVDIAENQLLLAACTRLMRVPGLAPAARRRLSRVRARLVDVTPLALRDRLPVWRPTRLNQRYHVALRLAELILAERSAELPGAGVRLDGFIIDLAVVFEHFVCTALSRALRRHGGRTAAQDRHYLDVSAEVRLKPDLIWYDTSGRPLAVADAKYKAERHGGFPGSDLYQMLAYCTVLGLPRGHLVYAKGNEPQRSHVVRGTGTVLLQHALDLGLAPGALLDSVSAVADTIAADSGSRPRGVTWPVA